MSSVMDPELKKRFPGKYPAIAAIGRATARSTEDTPADRVQTFLLGTREISNDLVEAREKGALSWFHFTMGHLAITVVGLLFDMRFNIDSEPKDRVKTDGTEAA